MMMYIISNGCTINTWFAYVSLYFYASPVWIDCNVVIEVIHTFKTLSGRIFKDKNQFLQSWMIMCWFVLSNLNVSCVPIRPYLIYKYVGEMKIMNFPFHFHISKRYKFSTALITPPIHLYRNNSMWHFIQVIKY